MNKIQPIARVALATLALFIILDIIKSILHFLPHLIELIEHTSVPITFLIITSVSIGIFIILGIVIFQQLLIKGDKWASKIVNYCEENQSQANSPWLGTTYRLVFIIAGILFIYWTIPCFLNLVRSLLLRSEPEWNRPLHVIFVPRLVSFVLRLALTVYLLSGASHFVRWQVKKTLEQCKELREE